MGRKSNKSRGNEKLVLAVTRTDVQMLIAREEAGEVQVTTETQPWREGSHSLTSEPGSQALAAVLKKMVTDHNVSGAPVRVVLSSDYCVTRVLKGENDEVERELSDLLDRTEHYIALGNGAKTSSSSRVALDAKTSMAWLSVSDCETIETIFGIVSGAGLQVGGIEHSLFAEARALHYLDQAQTAPALIVEISERNVEIGIAYGGQLLLDYRPGGHDAIDQLAEIADRHRERLLRYCNLKTGERFDGFSSVVICGPPEYRDQVVSQFEQNDLALTPLNFELLGFNWQTAHDSDSNLLGLVGAAKDFLQQTDDAPNLLAELKEGIRGPLLPMLARLAWPVAAVLLLTLGLYSYVQTIVSGNNALQLQRDQLETSRIQVTALQMRTEKSKAELEQLRHIKSKLHHPNWSRLVSAVGGCMPSGVWLHEIRVVDREIHIGGPSHTEDAVFEFTRYLEAIPFLAEVNIESMQPVSHEGHRAFKFDVKCRFADQVEGNDNDV